MTVASKARTAGESAPRSIPGLRLWLDAGNPGSAFNDGDAVATWKDLSGLGNDVAQATSTKRPLWRTQNRNVLTYNQATVVTDATEHSAIANCSIARVTAPAAYAVSSLQVNATAANAQAGVLSVPVTAGSTYTFAVSARTASATRTAGAVIDWYDVGNGLLSTSSGSTSALSASVWTNYSVTGAAPTGATHARISVLVSNSANLETFYADKFGFWGGSSTTWVPPITLPGGRPSVQFDGASTSLSVTLTLSVPITVYEVVAYVDSAVTSPSSVAGISNNIGCYRQAATQKYGIFAGASLLDGTITPASVVHAGVFNGASSTISVNGSATTGDTSSATVLGGIRVGASYNDGIWMQGHVATVLVYAGAHSAGTRKKLERWLGREYGITVAQ